MGNLQEHINASLDDLLFTLQEIEPINDLAISHWDEASTSSYTILMVTKGKCELSIEGELYLLQPWSDYYR